MDDHPTLDIDRLDRPHPNLLKYYLLASILAGPFFPLAALTSFLRYRTLRYRFDDEEVSMRWGVLFRKDISAAAGHSFTTWHCGALTGC